MLFRSKPGGAQAVAVEPAETAPESFAKAVPEATGTEPNPLHKSGTIWGAITAGFATVVGYCEQAMQAAIEWVGAMGDLAPLRHAAEQAGANVKAWGLGLTVAALGIVISRRVKASQEGKAG